MIDTEALHIPLDAKRALVVSEADWGLDEMEGLLKTMGGIAGHRMKLPEGRRIHPGTYVGHGKLEEMGRILEAENLDLLLLDFDLSPSQLRNIERAVKRLVLDRTGIILEIFSRHARTREAKLQVELARLQYIAPRLLNLWSHFERQRGSGGGALKGKGMGEKQIEVDRRMVKDRMSLLRRKLGELEDARSLHRRSRETLLKVAMVGYTNAGKSTLLNALTHSDVLVEDALFATLDATVRLLNPKSRPVVLGIDTVGFIDRLPHDLVASFRSTLREVLEADLLVHVLDASHPEVQRQFEVTMKVLDELGAIRRQSAETPPLPDARSDDKAAPSRDIPMLLVFNKMDRCSNPALVKVWAAGLMRQLHSDPPVFMSAHDAEQVNQLRETIMRYFDRGMETYEVVIPFEDGKTMAQIHELGNIIAKRETEQGTFVRLRTMPLFASQLNLDRYRI